MKRQILNNLKQWKQGKSRKPLILQGTRQVGKTYILKEFAKIVYDSCAYFNFESQPHLHELFRGSLKPQEIIKVNICQSTDTRRRHECQFDCN